MPNLDGFAEEKELFDFWFAHQRGRGAKDIFPSRPKGYRKAVYDLANYAANKGTAMQCRRRGDITGALMYEGICDKIYDKLPDFAKW